MRENSARGSRSLRKLTIISGLNRAREIMDTLAARQQMVDQQIRTWEVLDPRVLDALVHGAARSIRAARIPRTCIRRCAHTHRLRPIDAGAQRYRDASCKRLSVAPDRRGARDRQRQRLSRRLALSLLGAATRSIDIHPQFTAAAQANLRAMPGSKGGIRDAGCVQRCARWANTT